MYKNILSVGVGGFLGALLRFLISEWIPIAKGFPLPTLMINLVGSFLLSYVLTITHIKWRNPNIITLGIGTGLIGAFTTFSTFSVETIQLLHREQYIMAMNYVGLSIVGGILCVIAGMKIVRKK